MNKREYSDDEAREILKLAVDYQERDDFKYSQDQLFDLGREMGLTQDAIVKAEQDMRGGLETPVRAKRPTARERAVNSKAGISAEEAAFRSERMMSLYQHLAIYLMGVVTCFIINLVTSGLGFPWYLIVVFGWGMGLVGHFTTVGIMRGDAYEDAFDDWLNKQETRLRKRQRRLKQVENKD